MMNTLQGSSISHQTGKGKSSTHKYLGRGYVSPFGGVNSQLKDRIPSVTVVPLPTKKLVDSFLTEES